MDMELKYEIQLPITKIGHPTPNGLLLEPKSYEAAIKEYINTIVMPGSAILTNSEVKLLPNGGIIEMGNAYLGDIMGVIKNINIDESIAMVMVREEYKNLTAEDYRLMAAFLGERDGHVFIVKRILQYFIVPKLKFTNWGV